MKNDVWQVWRLSRAASLEGKFNVRQPHFPVRQPAPSPRILAATLQTLQQSPHPSHLRGNWAIFAITEHKAGNVLLAAFTRNLEL